MSDRQELQVGNIRVVITDDQMQEGIRSLVEQHEALQNLPKVVAATDPEGWIQNPRIHQHKRLRYCESWRGSQEEPLPGIAITNTLGVRTHTEVTDLMSWHKHQMKVDARHANHQKVMNL